MHIDHVRLWIEVIIPDVLQQHRTGDDLPGVLHQVFEQPRLARLKQDVLAAAGHAVQKAIQNKIADGITGLLLLKTPYAGQAPRRGPEEKLLSRHRVLLTSRRRRRVDPWRGHRPHQAPTV